MSSARTRIFPGRIEAWNLAAPVLPVALASWEIVARPAWSLDEQGWLRFVANILLLNGLHVVLSFVLIARLPELQSWVRERYRWSPGEWGLRLLVGVLLLASFFWAGGAYFRVEAAWRQVISLGLVILGMTAPHFHSLWQTRGLSFLYDEKSRREHALDDRELERLKREGRREKLLVTGVFVSFVGMQGIHVLSEGAGFLPEFARVGSPGAGYWPALRLGLVALNAIFVCLILFQAARSPVAERSFKTLYLARLVLYPMSGYSLIAFAGLSALHGLEYVAVFWKISGQRPLAERTSLRKAGVWAMLAFAPLLLPQFLVLWGWVEPGIALQGASALGIAVVYAHYVLDRSLYRMREATTRARVGPLLL